MVPFWKGKKRMGLWKKKKSVTKKGEKRRGEKKLGMCCCIDPAGRKRGRGREMKEEKRREGEKRETSPAGYHKESEREE